MSDPTLPPSDRRVKVPHLVFGLLFLGVAGIWALGASHLISGERLTILGPAVLIAAGVIGLVASLASGRNRNRTGSYLTDTAGYPTDHPTDQIDPITEDDDHTQEIR